MTIVSQDRLLVCNYANIAKIGIFDNPTSGGFDIDADDDNLATYKTESAAQDALDGLIRALRLDGMAGSSGVYTFPADERHS